MIRQNRKWKKSNKLVITGRVQRQRPQLIRSLFFFFKSFQSVCSSTLQITEVLDGLTLSKASVYTVFKGTETSEANTTKHESLNDWDHLAVNIVTLSYMTQRNQGIWNYRDVMSSVSDVYTTTLASPYHFLCFCFLLKLQPFNSLVWLYFFFQWCNKKINPNHRKTTYSSPQKPVP